MIILGNSANRNQQIKSVTLPYTTTANDQNIIITGTSGTLTVHTAVGNQGQAINLIHGGTSFTQIYTVNTTSAQTFAGLASGAFAFYTNQESIQIKSDNANWDQFGRYAQTGWIAFTISTAGLGTIANIKTYLKRDGKDLLIIGSFAVGTGTGVAASIAMPNSLTIDATVQQSTAINSLGVVIRSNGGDAPSTNSFSLFYDGSDASNIYISKLFASDTTFTKSLGNALWGTSGEFGMFNAVRIPITEFQP